MYPLKRLTILCGHYGSGKTNGAVNIAAELKKTHDNVTVADLDIVNPYFRTKDSADALAAAGIPLVSPAFANTNVDLPALPREVYEVVARRDRHAILDIGGDDRGALALGRLTPEILKENDYEMLLIVNSFRPLTPTPETTVTIAREIENACKISFTGVINNSNLGEFTTEEDVLNSQDYANTVAKLLGVKVVLTTVKQDLFEALNGKIDNLYPLVLQKKI